MFDYLENSFSYIPLSNVTFLIRDEAQSGVATTATFINANAEKHRVQRLNTIDNEKNNEQVVEQTQSLILDLLSEMNIISENLSVRLPPYEISQKEFEYIRRLRYHIYKTIYSSTVARNNIKLNETLEDNLNTLISNVVGSISVDDAFAKYTSAYEKQKNAKKNGAGGSYDFSVFQLRVRLPKVFQMNDSLTELNNVVTSAKLSQTGCRIILSGKPGIGKTLAAHYAALHWGYDSAPETQLFVLTQSNLLEMYAGTSEKRIQSLFDYFDTNKNERGVLFLDEGDEYLSENVDRKLSGSKNVIQINLGETSAFPNLCILLATNYIYKIDKPILSRFLTKIAYSMPTSNDLLNVIYTNLKIDNINLKAANDKSKNIAQLMKLCQEYWKLKLKLPDTNVAISYRDITGLLTTILQQFVAFLGKTNKLLLFINPTDDTELLISTHTFKSTKFDDIQTLNESIENIHTFQLYSLVYDINNIDVTKQSFWGSYKLSLICFEDIKQFSEYRKQLDAVLQEE